MGYECKMFIGCKHTGRDVLKQLAMFNLGYLEGYGPLYKAIKTEQERLTKQRSSWPLYEMELCCLGEYPTLIQGAANTANDFLLISNIRHFVEKTEIAQDDYKAPLAIFTPDTATAILGQEISECKLDESIAREMYTFACKIIVNCQVVYGQKELFVIFYGC